MNVLILSRDASFFHGSKEGLSETLQRHVGYCEYLEKCERPSSIKIMAYTPRKFRYQPLKLGNLEVYPTNSRMRLLMALDMFWLVLNCTRGWKPDLITTQTPWEEGHLGLIFSKWFKSKFLPQLHFDLLSSLWVREKKINIFYKYLAIPVLKKASAIRVVSQSMKEKLVAQLKIQSRLILVVPVGVPFMPVQTTDVSKSFYKNKIDEAYSDNLIVLFVGRLVEQKNLQEWIEIAKKLVEKLPQIQFVWAGDGPQKKILMTKINALGLQTHFKLFGNVAYKQLPEIYAAADVFLLTSHYEGNPRVVMEAMWAEVPVVSSACTGVIDSIQDGQNGYVVDSGDHNVFLERVLNLLESKDLSQKISSAALQYAQVHLNRDFLSKQWVDTWVSVCRNQSNE